MIKIFVDEALEAGRVLEIKGDNHQHLKVIRIEVEEEILIGDINFNEYVAEVISITKKGYTVSVKKASAQNLVPSRKVILYISLPKRKKFEDIIFKCTQVGVSEFVPMVSSRTIKNLKDKDFDRILGRWKKKARYGAELSGRKTIPVISDKILSFKEALEDFKKKNAGSGILFWEENTGIFVSENDLAGDMAVLIGPEGGFSEEEVREAKDYGFKIRTMGKLVMDVETACVAAASTLLCRGK
jgi:16S rRNA (uracil1498-N3)-methyltransferase